MRGALLLSFLALGVVGCRDRSLPAAQAPTVEVAPGVADARPELARLRDRSEANLDRVLESPAVDAAFERAFDRLGEDPAVAEAGAALLTRVGGTEPLASQASAFVADLAQTDAVQAVVQRFIAQHPGMSPDDISAALGAHTSAVVDGPAFQGALDAAIEHLFARARVERAFTRLGDRAVADSHLEKSLTDAFVAVLSPPAEFARLELRLGVPQNDAGFEAALAAYVLDAQRLERLLVAFANELGEQPDSRRAFVAILEHPALVRITAEEVGTLLAAPSFRTGAERTMIALIEERDAATLTDLLERTLVTDAAEDALVSWTDRIAREQPIVAAFGGALTAIAESPEFAERIREIYLGAPSSETA